MSTNNTIRGIKILPKSGVQITYIFHDVMKDDAGDDVDIPRERVEKIYADPKGTFFTALNLIKSHLLALTEFGHTIDAKYLKARTALEDPRMEKWRIDEVSITGDLDDTKIKIKGHRNNKRGAEIKAATDPTLIFNSNEYEFSGNLAEDWAALADECEAILGGNFLPSGQYKLELQ